MKTGLFRAAHKPCLGAIVALQDMRCPSSKLGRGLRYGCRCSRPRRRTLGEFQLKKPRLITFCEPLLNEPAGTSTSVRDCIRLQACYCAVKSVLYYIQLLDFVAFFILGLLQVHISLPRHISRRLLGLPTYRHVSLPMKLDI